MNKYSIISEANFQEVIHAQRFDAEFFHSKFQRTIDYLQSNFRIERIGDWGKVLKGRSVEYTDDPDGVPVIRSGDLSDIDDLTNLKRAHQNQRFFFLQKGDICVSSIGAGSIGKIQVFEHNGEFATVSEVTVIRQTHVNPHYLKVFLESEPGQLQIERYITGATGQQHLYPRDVESIVVPILPIEVQEEIARLVLASRAKKQEAKNLLEQAKHRVEEMILQAAK